MLEKLINIFYIICEVIILKKTIYSAMKNYVETTLSDVPNDLISISSETSVDKETGETSSFIRIEAEVQKGYDALSRCRFSVKIPNAPLKITENQLSETDYVVTFKNLQISFIDSRNNVYFRAEDYAVKLDA
uniref:hypothetical protein n=1 Tax=Roseburia sp. TaxID=2049040 RepID=UPI003FEE2FCD